MNRLVHIDFLKGLAIFLMVMGHALSWSMTDSGCPRTVDSWFVREVLYSFHMPLFMFMSGYVIDLKDKIWSWDFTPRVPKIGQFIYETSLIPNEYLATSICLQNVIGIALSIYCVACCLLVMKIIEKSEILALLFFGRKRQCS